MQTILFSIETSGPGGAEKMLISLVDSLNKKKFRPVVCLLKAGWLHEQLCARGHKTYVIPLRHTVDPSWIRQVIKLLRQEEVSVIHAHEFYMNSYAALLSRLTGIPCVTTVHGKNYASDKWYRRMAYRSVSKISKMIAVSTGIAEYLAASIGVTASRIRTIRNGIDPNVFAPQQHGKERARLSLGLAVDGPVIGCLGNLYPVKGHMYLVEAAATICKRYPNAVFLFAGRGQMLESLQNKVALLGIQNNIRFLGFREDTPVLLAAMDVFVLPSLSEGLPLSLLEAMAAERVVVATAVGGIPEVITDSRNGSLVKPADASELAEKILALLDNPGFAESLAKSARHDVVAHFNIEKMTKIYEGLYSELADRNKSK